MKMLKIVSKKFIKFKNLETKKSTSINVLVTRHSFKRAHNREIDEDYVRNVIFNEDPLDIDSDKKANEFRLFYPSQLHDNKELVVVIAIDDGYVIVQSLWEAKRIF